MFAVRKVTIGLFILPVAVIFLVRNGDIDAAIVNGDFETGDLTGWTVSAIDTSGSPLDPSAFVSVTSVGGNQLARFRTGELADGLSIATLQQTYVVDAAEPLLTFDFTPPTATPDPTGTGTSPFFDSFFVSLDNGVDTFQLLLSDQFSVQPDPFGTAPGDVTLGPSSASGFDFFLGADLSSQAGKAVTLFFDVIQEDDGFLFESDLDNVAMSEPLLVIPERSTFGVAVLLGLMFSLGRTASSIFRREGVFGEQTPD